MWMSVPISAVHTLTKLWALNPITIALAIPFLAHGLPASTFPIGIHCGNAIKISRMFEVHYHFCLLNLHPIRRSVSTTRTLTTLSTCSAICETFAVEFQALYFWATTAIATHILLIFSSTTNNYSLLYFGACLPTIINFLVLL
jgi:hypothetical protein